MKYIDFSNKLGRGKRKTIMQYENGDPGNWVIAESRHYQIRGSYESADLYSKEDGRYLTCVGDFYGDPVDGIIDKDERFCVTVGCGYIIYFLKDPFAPYRYNEANAQWIEASRDPEAIRWIEQVRQINDNVIEMTDKEGHTEWISIPPD